MNESIPQITQKISELRLKVGLLSYRSHPYSGGQGIYIKHLLRL